MTNKMSKSEAISWNNSAKSWTQQQNPSLCRTWLRCGMIYIVTKGSDFLMFYKQLRSVENKYRIY